MKRMLWLTLGTVLCSGLAFSSPQNNALEACVAAAQIECEAQNLHDTSGCTVAAATSECESSGY